MEKKSNDRDPSLLWHESVYSLAIPREKAQKASYMYAKIVKMSSRMLRRKSKLRSLRGRNSLRSRNKLQRLKFLVNR